MATTRWWEAGAIAGQGHQGDASAAGRPAKAAFKGGGLRLAGTRDTGDRGQQKKAKGR